MGGAFWVSAAQSAFVNALVGQLDDSVDPLLVLGTGATQLRRVFSPAQMPGILVAYMAGIRTALALAVGACGLALVASLFGTGSGSGLGRLKRETLRASGGAAAA